MKKNNFLPHVLFNDALLNELFHTNPRLETKDTEVSRGTYLSNFFKWLAPLLDSD